MAERYEKVIGLEVHVELSTKSKIFCGCSTAFGALPNTHTCPVCTGMPGALPVLNRKVLEYAVAAGLALNCQVAESCRFDRKNYFYPDNPQNYQISQFYEPVCADGYLEIETPEGKKRIGIHELHMEEDAGKLIHEEESGLSLIDYNRSGVPLIEIVTEPDMRTSGEVLEFLQKLRGIISYLGISDCKLQEGSMRVDVNLSVRKCGEKTFGTRTEMKNLGSFKAVSEAIEAEAARQAALLEAGETVRMETRRWDEKRGVSYAMRSKEDTRDYRYFPEPDIPPMRIDPEWVEAIRDRQPELAHEKRERYVREYQIPAYDAGILTGEKALADFFEAAAKISGKPKKVSNWLMGETLRLLKEEKREAKDLKFSPESLAKLIDLIDAGTITGTVAKQVFERMYDDNADPVEDVKKRGLAAVSDEKELEKIIAEVLAENAAAAADYRAGKQKALGFLTGKVMGILKGRANAAKIQEILRKMLEN